MWLEQCAQDVFFRKFKKKGYNRMVDRGIFFDQPVTKNDLKT